MLVIFDCDGVLINSEEMALESDCAFFAQYGLHFSREEFIEFASGLVKADMLDRLDRRHREVHGVGLPDGFVETLERHYREDVYPKIRAIDGVVEVLEELQRRGIPFCVASNSDMASLHEKLEMTGLRHYFTHIFSKDQVARPKPAGDLFLFAAQTMGFAPQNCRVVEDSVTGMTAVMNAGMTGIGYSGGAHRPKTYPQTLKAAGAAVVVTAMNELLPVLLRPRLSQVKVPMAAAPAPF